MNYRLQSVLLMQPINSLIQLQQLAAKWEKHWNDYPIRRVANVSEVNGEPLLSASDQGDVVATYDRNPEVGLRHSQIPVNAQWLRPSETR